MAQRSGDQNVNDGHAKKPTYRPPEVMLMNEADVLKVFQITSAGVSWWA